jgi:hypothetical protein
MFIVIHYSCSGQSYEPVSVAFFSSAGLKWQLRPEDTAQLLNSNSKKHHALPINQFWDWTKALDHDTSRIPFGLTDTQVILTRV